MSTKFQNKANLLEAGSRQLEAFPPNKPIYPVNPVHPVKNTTLRNKPNMCVFDLIMRMSAENKPNLQSSIINHEFRNKANFSFLNPCIPASIYSCFSPNEPNLKPGSWPLAASSLFTFLLFVNRIRNLYNFLQSRKGYYSGSIRVEPDGGKEWDGAMMIDAADKQPRNDKR